MRVGVALILVASLVGFFAGRLIRSPADAAAEADPPAASVITAPVELLRVTDSVLTRGSVTALSRVSALPSVVPPGVDRAVITAAPVKIGDRVEPGSVIAEVSGRPVFFLPGDLPAYRTIGLGDTGPDVEQLQAALADAGLRVAVTGRFDASTQAQVAALYDRNGYAPDPGVVMPAYAAAYVGADEATVVAAKTRLGASIKDSSLELASGDLVVLVATTTALDSVMTPGREVRLAAELIGETSTGSVTTTIAQGSGRAAVIEPDDALRPAWSGQDVRVEFVGDASAARQLAVPSAALLTAANGSAAVKVVDARGGTRSVEVQVGAAGDGVVAVVPEKEGLLRRGQSVVVGVQ